jgi:hypothetical protein
VTHVYTFFLSVTHVYTFFLSVTHVYTFFLSVTHTSIHSLSFCDSRFSHRDKGSGLVWAYMVRHAPQRIALYTSLLNSPPVAFNIMSILILMAASAMVTDHTPSPPKRPAATPTAAAAGKNSQIPAIYLRLLLS